MAPHATETVTAIAFLRDDTDPKKPALSTLMPGAAHVVPLIDPVAGDSLLVVPAGLGRATIDPHNYAEFSALPTAAGLVVTPLTDDLDMRVTQSRVTLSRPNGLQLTAPSLATADSPAALASTSDGPCFLDLAAWGHAAGGNFLDAQRRLRKTLAAMKPDEANRARIALARFYLGNGFGAEALGLIELTQANDPSLQGDLQLQSMRAAADFMMGRYHDAHNDIAGQAFDNNRHAAFWRGLTESALENWDGARKAFALADPVLHRYPAEWQARARIAEANAALAAGGIETADQELTRLPQNLPKPVMLEAQLVRAQLYAQEGRTHDAMDLFEAIENGGDDHVAAEAIYDRVEDGLAAGALSQDAAISQLEMLRYRWRGDVLELKTLRKLGALYFGKQRWHDGLQILRTASQSFPNEDVARQCAGRHARHVRNPVSQRQGRCDASHRRALAVLRLHRSDAHRPQWRRNDPAHGGPVGRRRSLGTCGAAPELSSDEAPRRHRARPGRNATRHDRIDGSQAEGCTGSLALDAYRRPARRHQSPAHFARGAHWPRSSNGIKRSI